MHLEDARLQAIRNVLIAKARRVVTLKKSAVLAFMTAQFGILGTRDNQSVAGPPSEICSHRLFEAGLAFLKTLWTGLRKQAVPLLKGLGLELKCDEHVTRVSDALIGGWRERRTCFFVRESKTTSFLSDANLFE